MAEGKSLNSTKHVTLRAPRMSFNCLKPASVPNSWRSSASLTVSPRFPTNSVLHGGLSLVLLTAWQQQMSRCWRMQMF